MRSRRCSFAVVGLAALVWGACGSAEPVTTTPASAPVHAAPAAEPASPLVERLATLARWFGEHSACEDTCCLGKPPAFTPYPWQVPTDTQQQELRTLLDTHPPPQVHGLAALWLAHANDVADLSRLMRCSASNEPAGVVPSVFIGQVFRECDTLEWEEKTLGRACLDAMGNIVRQRFADASQAHAWMAAHPNPLDSFDYWQHVLTTRPADKEQLDQLYQRGPELFLRVTAQQPDLLGQEGEPLFLRAARQGVGPDSLLRVLRREASWPELDGDGFHVFATTVFTRAPAIFDARHSAALLAMWEERTCCRQDYVWVALAIAVSRMVPEESRRVLKHTLASCVASQAPLLEELAHRYPQEEAALLLSWHGRTPESYEDAYTTAIFTGLAKAGLKARPVLASLVRKRTPPGENRAAVVAMIAATKAVGYDMPTQCDGYLAAEGGKGTTREQADRAEREAVVLRTGCVNEALRLLRNAPHR